jgi:hypothetical protein
MANYDANDGDHVALAIRELFELKRNAGEITSKFGVHTKVMTAKSNDYSQTGAVHRLENDMAEGSLTWMHRIDRMGTIWFL